MYANRLVAHDTVRDRVIDDILPEDSVVSAELASPLILIDTAGALMYEDIDEDIGKNESKYNFGEADLTI